MLSLQLLHSSINTAESQVYKRHAETCLAKLICRSTGTDLIMSKNNDRFPRNNVKFFRRQMLTNKVSIHKNSVGQATKLISWNSNKGQVYGLKG